MKGRIEWLVWVCERPASQSLRGTLDCGYTQNAHVLLLKDCLCAFDNIYDLFKMATNKPNVWTSQFVSFEFLFEELSAKIRIDEIKTLLRMSLVWFAPQIFTLLSTCTSTLVCLFVVLCWHLTWETWLFISLSHYHNCYPGFWSSPSFQHLSLVVESNITSKYINSSTLLEYFHCVLLYSLTPLHFRGKLCTFYDATNNFEIKILHKKHDTLRKYHEIIQIIVPPWTHFPVGQILQ